MTPTDKDMETARGIVDRLFEPEMRKNPREEMAAIIAAALKAERERCAQIADAHKGAAARRRQEKGQRLSKLSPEAQASITDEERGEDIAADIIGRNIRTGSAP